MHRPGDLTKGSRFRRSGCMLSDTLEHKLRECLGYVQDFLRQHLPNIYQPTLKPNQNPNLMRHKRL